MSIGRAVLFKWDKMNDLETGDEVPFEGYGDPRFVKKGLSFETPYPMSGQPSTERSLLKLPPQPVEQLWKRLSAETINLADHELLEVILTPAVGPENVCRIVQTLLLEFGTFGQVVHAAAADLMAIEGLREVGVTTLKTVGMAALHMLRKAIYNVPKIRMWDDLMRYVIARLQHERVEVLFCIFLDATHRVIADEELNRGTINFVAGHPREIMRRCILLDATAIILVHNHPTGTLEPSRNDIAFTQGVVRAAESVDVAVHDHIIVGSGECFSFRVNKLFED